MYNTYLRGEGVPTNQELKPKYCRYLPRTRALFIKLVQTTISWYVGVHTLLKERTFDYSLAFLFFHLDSNDLFNLQR